MNPPDTLEKISAQAQQDPEMMLKMLDVEIANKRAKRLHQDADRRRLVRALCVLALLGMILVLAGAFWYLQVNRPAHRPPANRPLPATASPAPGASAPSGR